MTDIGVKRNMIHVAGTMQEAESIIQAQNIGLVLSDYFIGGGSGFDLFKLIRQSYQTKNKNLSLILVTSNISQTAVAKAAEEDVDSFIIKPYTLQSIQENLLTTICDKVQPSPYILKVEEGKALIASQKYEEAIVCLEQAMTLHQKPSLALFYLGQAKYLIEQKDEAKGKYNKGLTYNSIHFKCLIGLYDLFMKDKKFVDAYQIAKKIVKNFPANSERLAQIIRLTIITKNYDDIETYYEVFTQLDERPLEIINYLGAGLYVSGKWFMSENEVERAMSIYEKIGVSCADFSKFLKSVVVNLVNYRYVSEAEKYLARFQPKDIHSDDYLISDYLVNFSKEGTDPAKAVNKGLELYNKNIHEPDCLKLMIKNMHLQGWSDKAKPYEQKLESLLESENSLAKAS